LNLIKNDNGSNNITKSYHLIFEYSHAELLIQLPDVLNSADTETNLSFVIDDIMFSWSLDMFKSCTPNWWHL